MEHLKKGKEIPTIAGVPLKIERYIAGGGQGDVYEVIFNGEKKALKWYKPNAIKDPDGFYENLKRNVGKGSPNKAFLWPITATQMMDNSFGYVMDLRPEGYYELADFMLAKTTFKTFKAATEACIRIVSAFQMLHNKGFCYQDMNDGNFFINPKTGDVLICDNDNVAPNDLSTFIMGTPRYMAPEIVMGTSKPNTQTDRYSLSVILFMLLCMNHPLEGKHWVVPCLTPDIERALYGERATFIYDPLDNSNCPVRGVHTNVMKRWQYMPSYMKDAFLKAFSQDALKNPANRMRELDWLKVLVRFQSDIVRCQSCGNEVFIHNASDTKCDGCGKMLPVINRFKLADYTITAAKGTRIYRCQLGMCNADNALERIGIVIARTDNPNILGFQNASIDTIVGITPSGKQNLVKPGEVVPLKPGIRLEIFNGKIEIQ